LGLSLIIKKNGMEMQEIVMAYCHSNLWVAAIIASLSLSSPRNKYPDHMNERTLPMVPVILRRDTDFANSLIGNHLFMIKVRATLKIGPGIVVTTVPISTQ